MVGNFASLFNITQWVGPQTKWQLPLQPDLYGWHLTINVCARAHSGSACGFLVFWLQIATDPFFFVFSQCFLIARVALRFSQIK